MAFRTRGIASFRHQRRLNLRVAVVIVGYRNPGDVMNCLAALSTSTYRDFDVVVCENGGEEAVRYLSRELATRGNAWPEVEVVDPGSNIGFAAGVNRAIAGRPAADAWWLLNPDTKPTPTALAALVERLARGDCEAVGGVLYWTDGRVQSLGGRWRSWMARAVSLGMGKSIDSPVDPQWVEQSQNYLSGACMLVSRRFVDLTGPMREDYFLYCEEVEWCLRAQDKGARLGYASRSRTEHAHGSTTGAGQGARNLPRLPIYLNERNRLLLTRDLYPWRFPVAGIAALGLLGLRFGRRGAWRQLGYGLAGWWAGVTNRRGPAL